MFVKGRPKGAPSSCGIFGPTHLTPGDVAAVDVISVIGATANAELDSCTGFPGGTSSSRRVTHTEGASKCPLSNGLIVGHLGGY